MHDYRLCETPAGQPTTLEFLDADAAGFFSDLQVALSPLAARFDNAESPGLDDDYTFVLTTVVGRYGYHKDAWGSAFITVREAVAPLSAITDALAGHPRFRLVVPRPAT